MLLRNLDKIRRIQEFVADFECTLRVLFVRESSRCSRSLNLSSAIRALIARSGMKNYGTLWVLCAAIICSMFPSSAFADSSTSISYQGILHESSVPVNGSMEFRFTLWDHADVGSGLQIGSEVELATEIVAGLFSVDLDFGAQVYGQEDRYLQIEVREVGDFTYTIFGTRQRVNSSPFSLQTRGIFVDANGRVETSSIQIQRGDSNQPVGITQEIIGGSATMELTTTDSNGDQAPRVVLRGSADETDIEFYRGGLGAELLTMFMSGSTGNIGIGTSNPQDVLDVNGIIRSGGVRLVGGADIAEPFDIAADSPILPGMVVSINPDVPGALRVSEQEYDVSVVGIVSGANGIQPALTLSQHGTIADGEHPVALTGRVWCLVDADANGPIALGDMLTTSATFGHAMRADDRNRSFGSTIGKAMTPLESGRGYVLVLVNLQ